MRYFLILLFLNQQVLVRNDSMLLEACVAAAHQVIIEAPMHWDVPLISVGCANPTDAYSYRVDDGEWTHQGRPVPQFPI